MGLRDREGVHLLAIGAARQFRLFSDTNLLAPMTDPTPDVPTPSAEIPRRNWRKILGLTGAGLVITPLLLILFWTWLTLHWSYSEGERAGTLQKFSKKGWICKTWEGELQLSSIPGSAPIIWAFSVRDDAVANRLSEAVAHSGRVALEYEEHRGVPSNCFGETDYFVVGVRTVE